MGNVYLTKDAVIADRARAWRIAQAEADRAKALLVAAVKDGEDVLSEYTMAVSATVQRSTIRNWLGK